MEFGAPNMPAQDIKPQEAQSVAGNVQYAGFWIRLTAAIIDGIILAIVAKILFGANGATMSGGELSVNYDGWRAIIPILYSVLFWKYFSATPGKMLLKLKVCQENGQNLEWKNAILRYIGYIPSLLVVFLGFIWIGFDKKKQGWHDKIASTIVIKK